MKRMSGLAGGAGAAPAPGLTNPASSASPRQNPRPGGMITFRFTSAQRSESVRLRQAKIRQPGSKARAFGFVDHEPEWLRLRVGRRLSPAERVPGRAAQGLGHWEQRR